MYLEKVFLQISLGLSCFLEFILISFISLSVICTKRLVAIL